MARILYGVQGNGRGHAVRALTVARHYPEHEFLFVTHTDGVPILRPEFQVYECPNPELPIRSHRVATVPMAFSNLRFWHRQTRVMQSILRLADKFEPDVAITDYEYFVPRAGRLLRIPCLSIDHQHIVTACTHEVPLSQFPSYAGAFLAARILFSHASRYLVVSFFHPASHRNNSNTRLVPPLLREVLLQREPRDGEHVLAYQSTSTFNRFLPFLREIQRPVIVYGFNSNHSEGNLHFRKHSEEGFLDDLASCSYVICGGGHTLISEALFNGKPVISFPISNLFEQFLNAHYVEKMGYGRCLTGFNPKPGLIPAFEAQLDRFRKNIRSSNFFGNTEIFSLIDRFIRDSDLIH